MLFSTFFSDFYLITITASMYQLDGWVVALIDRNIQVHLFLIHFHSFIYLFVYLFTYLSICLFSLYLSFRYAFDFSGYIEVLYRSKTVLSFIYILLYIYILLLADT